MNKEELIDVLIKNSNLASEEEFEKFDTALIKLSDEICVTDLELLCEVFNDDTKDDGEMFAFLHLIESMISNEYVEKLIDIIPSMSAKGWAEILNIRLINSKKYFSLYQNIIVKIEEDKKKYYKDSIEKLKKDNPSRFAEKANVILANL